MKNTWTYALAIALAASFAATTMAQDRPVPQPAVVERPIATPRASVAAHRNLDASALDAAAADACCRQWGAADNFAWRDARMVIRPGTTILFSIPRAEGVVYDKSCGWLALFMRLDVQGDDGQWRHVDSYFRHVRVCGPHIAHAEDIAIPYRPLRPGDFLVRARVYTYAIPLSRDLELDRSNLRCAGIARDSVLTHVRVVELPTPADLEWEAAEAVDLVDERVSELEDVSL